MQIESIQYRVSEFVLLYMCYKMHLIAQINWYELLSLVNHTDEVCRVYTSLVRTKFYFFWTDPIWTWSVHVNRSEVTESVLYAHTYETDSVSSKTQYDARADASRIWAQPLASSDRNRESFLGRWKNETKSHTIIHSR